MSVIVDRHQPCPCGNSSDAYCTYSDGHGYCYSCSTYYPSNETEVNEYSYETIEWRSINKDTMTVYKVTAKVDPEGKPVSIGFPYSDTALKVRSLSEKKFHSVGDMSNANLFGQQVFQAGQAKAITITEGELDALSVYQMLGSRYPVVSVRSASSAKKDCARQFDWLNSFERIYLCFDNDDPGRKATEEVAALFEFNKVYNVKLTKYKDANEFLEHGEAADFLRLWYNSRRFLPEGILSSFSEFDAIIDQKLENQAVTYPFPTLQRMTYGLRQGECTLFTALEGVGKTEIIRAIEHHVLKTTDVNVGIIHLEENESKYLKKLAGYEMATPCHLPDTSVSDTQIKEAYRSVIRRDGRLHLHKHMESDNPDDILARIRFLATVCDCKYIFFDHITIAVTGSGDGDQTTLLDYMSTKLGKMSEALNVGIAFISHVNDDGKTRGSRNISKMAHTWIHLNRNIEAETEVQRNTTHLTIKKNRFAHHSGPAGTLFFNPETYVVSEHIPGALPI